MLSSNFNFVASHLKIHPVVHLNTCGQKEKFIKSFVILML